jgi:hypothetical protein
MAPYRSRRAQDDVAHWGPQCGRNPTIISTLRRPRRSREPTLLKLWKLKTVSSDLSQPAYMQPALTRYCRQQSCLQQPWRSFAQTAPRESRVYTRGLTAFDGKKKLGTKAGVTQSYILVACMHARSGPNDAPQPTCTTVANNAPRWRHAAAI